MPSLNPKFLKLLHDEFTKYKVFVETGTFMGETINKMEPFFESLYTIEINENFYKNAVYNYTGNKIKFINGDSSDIFKTLLPEIQEKTIFFLDGHWSGGDTGRGHKDCPLIEEIELINSVFKNDAIIIIDDFRLFGTYVNEDWRDINKQKIIEILNDRCTEIYHLPDEVQDDDRLIIHIKSLSADTV